MDTAKKTRELGEAIKRLPLAMVITEPGLDDNPIVYINDAFRKITLYSAEYAIGRNCRFLQGPDTDPAAVARLRRGIEAGEDVSVDLLNYRADGTAFMNRLLITPIRDENGSLTAFLGVQRELPTKEAQRTHADDDPTLLPGRPGQDVMLAEVQHRVKNHLAMIVSMIRLQAERKVSRRAFEALSHRVESLALLYDELSGRGVATAKDETVPAGAYLSRVCAALISIEGRGSIRVNVECEEIDLPVDVTARLGLLLTEFLTNALTHAFAGRDEGVIRVRFQKLTRGGVRLMVEDDGVGLPEGSEWPFDARGLDGDAEAGMGGSIVAALTGSLEAELDVNSSPMGTVVSLDFAR